MIFVLSLGSTYRSSFATSTALTNFLKGNATRPTISESALTVIPLAAQMASVVTVQGRGGISDVLDHQNSLALTASRLAGPTQA